MKKYATPATNNLKNYSMLTNNRNLKIVFQIKFPYQKTYFLMMQMIQQNNPYL